MAQENRLKFIVALAAHRHLGQVFVPYLVEQLSAYYSIKHIVRPHDLKNIDYQFTRAETEIIRLTGKYSDAQLASKFARNMNSTEFFNQSTDEYLQNSVMPYVSKQMYAVALLVRDNNVPLFLRAEKFANLYDEDIIIVPQESATIRFSVVRSDEGTRYFVRLYQGEKVIPLINRKVKIVTLNPCILFVRDTLLIFSDVDSKKVLPFLERESIFVPKEIEEEYYSNFVTQLVRNYEIEAKGFTINHITAPGKAILSLERNIKGQPVLVLSFAYGKHEILVNYSQPALVTFEKSNDEFTFQKYIRSKTHEDRIADFLKSRGLREDAGGFILPNIHLMSGDNALYALVDWLASNSQEINVEGIEVRQSFFDKVFFTGEQEIEFDIKQNRDWFDLYALVHIGGFSFPFIKLRRYILEGKREFELPNGEIALLPEEWFEQYAQLIQSGNAEGDKLVFSRHFYNLLKYKVPGKLPEALGQLEKSLKKAGKITVPETLNATLRSYQLKGFQWLYSLIINGMGGCLADDMGLGKTLQTLALLLKTRKKRSNDNLSSSDNYGQLSLFDPQPTEKEAVQPASLIVVPTSLIHNWVNEIRKFAPSLQVYVHKGAQRDKGKTLQQTISAYDVFITSYGTLRMDIEILSRLRFFITILDESQYIKNKASKTFDAVMAVKTEHRIILTGTPIENSLADLWSQMNFLNRGLLGSYSFFRQNIQTPIENRTDEKAEERLQLLIRPFILRRTKAEVATDLPPLTESVIYCTMSADQQKVYDTEKTLIRNAVLANIEEKGLGNSAIVILQGLTRLRLLANHPQMVNDQEEDIESGKYSEIFRALANIISENHKVLIFSSFVKHLILLKRRIEQEGWKYSMLTGSTRNREEVISNFQNVTDNRIFLISLKAGGVGLNLTGADYVFILDPWWNPAAENQAINRAHRIGQDKNVFVYRFITEQTIEEKIQLLKERKSALADKFINSNNPFKAITKEEIASLLD